VVGGQRRTPAALPSGKKPGTQAIGGCVGPQDQSERVRKISPPSGIRSVKPRSESLYRLNYPGPRVSTRADVNV
jgi:hypothetical protein